MKIIKIYALFIVSAAIILVASITSFAANFTVTNTNDGGAGSLRQAILDANAAGTNDVIGFDSGVFSSPKTITLTTGELVINSNGNLTINGPGANLLSISGNDASRVFNVSATTSALTATINNLTVRNGYKCASNFAGGGLAVNDSGTLLVTLNLESVIFTENNVGCGGSGGGLQVIRNGSLNINNSIFRNNSATQGGGIGCGSGAGDCIAVNISNTLFEGNVTGIAGGGGFICCGTGTPVSTPINIENSAFINNTAERNGSAFRESNQATFSWKNVTIAYNKSTQTGPALQLQLGSHTFENVTIAYNTTATSATAGGVQDSGNIGFVRFRNSIVAKNRNANGESDLDFEGVTPLNSLGYNIFGVLHGTTTVSGTTTGNQMGVNPLLDFIPRNNGGITKNLALRPGSPAIDSGDPGNFLATDQRGISRPVDGDGNGSALPDIGAFEKRPEDIVPVSTRFDFDGDGKTDVSIFRPGPAEWWYLKSSDGGNGALQFGRTTDKIAPGDYDGDGKTDVAVWRESAGDFYILNSSNLSVRIENFGLAGDKLTVGDWDGDGKDDPAFYRSGAQSVFYFRGSLNNPGGNITFLPWGTTGDIPIGGDFDGDGKQDLAVFRPSNAIWYIRNSSNNQVRYVNFGLATDKLVPADYDGDGKTDIAVYRNGVWYILQSTTGQIRYVNFGISSDRPVPADYDGDGKADIAIYRDGNWYLDRSTSGFAVINFGLATDTPVPAAFNN